MMLFFIKFQHHRPIPFQNCKTFRRLYRIQIQKNGFYPSTFPCRKPARNTEEKEEESPFRCLNWLAWVRTNIKSAFIGAGRPDFDQIGGDINDDFVYPAFVPIKIPHLISKQIGWDNLR